MKKKCKKLITAKDGKRAIYIDVDNEKEILAYINQDNRHKKKFKHIAELILQGLKNRDLYDKEDIDSSSKNVTAMKFFKGQENDRIYCKELRTPSGVYIIVTSVLYEKKKSNKLTEEIKNIIKKIGRTDYEI